MTAVGAALWAGVGVALLARRGGSRRLGDARTGAGRGRPRPGVSARGGAAPAAAAVAIGVLVLAPWPLALLLAPAAGAAAWFQVTSAEPASVRRRREQVAADLPGAVDLLAAAWSAGADLAGGVAAVASSSDGPVADELARVVRRLRLGEHPAEAWALLGRGTDGLALLGRTVSRAVETGAPLGEVVRLLARDLRTRQEAEATAQARRVGVRATAPVGACLMPAFLLLGVVPLVASSASALLQ